MARSVQTDKKNMVFSLMHRKFVLFCFLTGTGAVLDVWLWFRGWEDFREEKYVPIPVNLNAIAYIGFLENCVLLTSAEFEF